MPVAATDIQLWQLIANSTSLWILGAHTFEVIANHVFFAFSTDNWFPVTADNFFSEIAVGHALFEFGRQFSNLNRFH
ncbi:hypothetical protein XP1511_03165 [Xanthomonas perforans]|uniref:Uncharacterized protein n=1 Tax=Xanthomonas perforans TaxID=442694 RepID=A0ABR5ENJ2_XANPE|nr:hypothetical protein XP315_19335 [Xanthomonas perforans]KLC16089.1 hypothetical protein XP56_16065 [Xanthomonas perforans]KLC21233.1 hypothetical protein XP712_08205 [Xanthomonas perforans]KLC36353.1 hypothetical protein XP112_12990 [Xanthomonas perforans]KLC39155.1 hypothetical protein XP1013_01470 [Xanthomonas perforans]